MPVKWPTGRLVGTGNDRIGDVDVAMDYLGHLASEIGTPRSGEGRIWYDGADMFVRDDAGVDFLLGGASGGGGAGVPQRDFFENMPTRALVQSDFLDEPIPNQQVQGLRTVPAGAGSGAASVIGANVLDHPGVWGIHTGTAAAGRTFLLSMIQSSFQVGNTNGVTRFGSWVQVSTLSTPTQRFVFRAGFSSVNLPNTILHGITFEYQDDQNGGRWQGVTNATGETFVDLGITVVAGLWVLLELEVNAAGTRVDFFIDGVNQGNITTAADIPSGSGFNLFTNIHIMKLVGTTDRHFYIDAYYVYQEISR